MGNNPEVRKPSLPENDYLAILGFIEKLNDCLSLEDMESLIKSELLPLLRADTCVYGWVDPEFKNGSLMGAINIPAHTKKIYSNILHYDPVGAYALAHSRSVIAYDIDLPRKTISEFVDRFYKDHPEISSKEHPYFLEMETLLAAFDLPTPTVGLGIHRLKGNPGAWTFREVRILELLRPHIVHSIKSLGIKYELEKAKSLNNALMDTPTPMVVFDQNNQCYFQNHAYKQWVTGDGEQDLIEKLLSLNKNKKPHEIAITNETDLNLPFLTRKDGVYHLDITKTGNINGTDGHYWIVKICKPTGAYTEANLRMQKASLSKREMEVCYLAKDGFKVADIAERLFISPATVETHLKNIYKKLNVHNRAQMISRLANSN